MRPAVVATLFYAMSGFNTKKGSRLRCTRLLYTVWYAGGGDSCSTQVVQRLFSQRLLTARRLVAYSSPFARLRFSPLRSAPLFTPLHSAFPSAPLRFLRQSSASPASPASPASLRCPLHLRGGEGGWEAVRTAHRMAYTGPTLRELQIFPYGPFRTKDETSKRA